MSTPSAFSRDELSSVLNRAADTIRDVADLPDEGTIDALNLLVNTVLYVLDEHDPGVQEIDLNEVVEAQYGEETTLSDVLRWIAS